MSDLSIYMRAFNLLAKLSPSQLEFVTSANIEGTGGEVVTIGAQVAGIKIKDNVTGESRFLDFYGLGAGMGVGTPIGGSMSTPEFVSMGSTIIKGLACIGRLTIKDLRGPSQMYCFGMGAGFGVSGSLIFFRAPPPPMPPLFFSGAVWLEGMTLATPGVGIMLYSGVWIREAAD